MDPTFAIINILIGLFICFYGYPQRQITFFIVGFITASNYFLALDADLDPLIAIGGGALVGVILGFLAARFFRLGSFIIGSFLGIAITFMISSSVDMTDAALVGLLVLAILIGGALTVIFIKLMFIIATAFGGAQVAVIGLVVLAVEELTYDNISERAIINQEVSSALNAVMIIGWLVLSIAGVWRQFRNSGDD